MLRTVARTRIINGLTVENYSLDVEQNGDLYLFSKFEGDQISECFHIPAQLRGWLLSALSRNPVEVKPAPVVIEFPQKRIAQ